VNIFDAFSEISVGALLRFVKYILRIQRINLHKFKIQNRFFKMQILKTKMHFQDFSNLYNLYNLYNLSYLCYHLTSPYITNKIYIYIHLYTFIHIYSTCGIDTGGRGGGGGDGRRRGGGMWGRRMTGERGRGLKNCPLACHVQLPSCMSCVLQCPSLLLLLLLFYILLLLLDLT